METQSNVGKLLIGVTGGLAIGVSIVCASFVRPAFRRICLPYMPATDQQVRNVFEALKTGGTHRSLLDVGSGDGRIVIEAAKRRHWRHAHGVELNSWLVWYSRLASLRHGTHTNTAFFVDDLWTFGVREYDDIVVFGVEQMMDELEAKLLAECKDGCRIVACRFPLPNLRPAVMVGEGIDAVWLYRIQADKVSHFNSK